jgi:hypothetical protein
VTDGRPLSPLGAIAETGDPVYRWYGDGSSTWYEIYVNKDVGFALDQWVEASKLTSDESGTLEYSGVRGHTAGNYTWWVRGWSPTKGYGAWSEGAHYSLTE